MEKMDISIVIPAYNEEARIIPTLEKIYDYLVSAGMKFEILVVDDGSVDKTTDAVEGFAKSNPGVILITHRRNRGKGAAVRTGVLGAKGDLVLFSDADLSTPVEEFEKLSLALYEGYDIAIGSRGMKKSNIVVKQPLHRRCLGKIFPCLVRLLVMENFRDTQCGFKLFKGETARRLFGVLETEGFAFDVEVLYRAVKSGIKVKEVPVTWKNSAMSRVSMLKGPVSMLCELLRIRHSIPFGENPDKL